MGVRARAAVGDLARWLWKETHLGQGGVSKWSKLPAHLRAQYCRVAADLLQAGLRPHRLPPELVLCPWGHEVGELHDNPNTGTRTKCTRRTCDMHHRARQHTPAGGAP